jgi:Zn-dependent metalloprotease
MLFRSRGCQVFAVLALVGVFATSAWAMRPQDESATKAKPGVQANPDEIYQALQQAQAKHEAWKAQNPAPVAKKKLQRPVRASLMAVPAGQSGAVSPDLDVRFDPATGAASSIKIKNTNFSTVPQVGSIMGFSATMEAPAGTSATALGSLHQHRNLLRVKDAYQEFTPKRSHSDALGLTHHKFQQTYKGLPIWGREVWVHMNQQNATYLVEGKVQPTPTLDTQPRLTSDEAIAKAQQDMPGTTEPAAQLMVYVDDLNISHMVWHVTARKGFERWHWFVDAGYGAILRHFSDTRYESVAASGADLYGTPRNFYAWHDTNTNEYALLDTTLPMYGADPVLPDNLGAGNLIVFDAKNQDPNSQITG